MIARDSGRFAITIAGVGMAVVLVLFLLALYDGVRTEANGWVASRRVDAWVAQTNTTNFIKASSFLRASVADLVRASPNVAEVSPILRLITLIETGERRVTAIVVGIDTASNAAQPTVVEGTGQLTRRTIILDWALSRRAGRTVGDSVILQGRAFHIVGLSRGTNSVLTQFAFISIDDAQALLGFPGVASYMLVRAAPGASPAVMIDSIVARVPKVSVLSQADFAHNNMEELRGGLIPILTTVAVLGAVVAITVLTLLLYGSVLERREDYALLKAIGAPSRVLAWVMFAQAVAAVCGGVALGLLIYGIAVPVAARLAPAVPLSLSMQTVVVVAAGALCAGALGALIPLARVARIHPAEVFRA